MASRPPPPSVVSIGLTALPFLRKKKEIDKVFQTISPIINSYMEKNSVKILFDAKNIFMARNDLNLTNDILEAINKEAK